MRLKHPDFGKGLFLMTMYPNIGRSIKRLKTPLRHLKESEFVIFGNPGYTWHVLRHKSPAVVSDSVSGVFDGQGNFLPTVS